MKKKVQPKPPVPTAQPPRYSAKQYIRAASLICAFLSLLIYANTLTHDYTVDDGTVIANNKITKKGIAAIPEIFSSAYRAGFWDRKEGLYRPLSVAMFAVEWQLAPENPLPGHLINILLFALTGYLLFNTLALLFNKYSILFPFLITILFIVHPIHTEVVANIKSRDEILAFLFIILTFRWLYNFLLNKKSIMLILSCVAFFLAYLSKESAITILAVIPFFIWFFSTETIASDLKISAAYLLVTLLYLFIRYQVLGELRGSAELQLVNNSLLGAGSLAERLGTAFAIIGRYLVMLVLPFSLSFDYSYNQIPLYGFASIQALVPLLIFLAMLWFAFKNLRAKNPAAFGIIFLFGTFSLVSNVLFLIESTMAERFMYMPSLGFFIMISYFILKFSSLLEPIPVPSMLEKLKRKPFIPGLLVLVILFYSGRAISRNAEWKDNFTLLEKDVKTAPNSARIRYAFGSALLIEKALQEKNPSAKSAYLDHSIAELEKGVAILPNYAEAWYHLGLAYKEKGIIPSAVNAFEKARSYKEFNTADFYISAGLAYGLSKKYDAAIADFTKAISIDPANAEAYNNKGLYYTEKGVTDSALVFLDKAIALKPTFTEALYNKGNTYAKMGDYRRAIEQYQQALTLKPGYIDALLNTGNSYAALKDFESALKYFRLVEKEEPSNPKVLYNIGITYRILGDENNASIYMEKAKAAGASI
jgi:protein O-mannosyl-transferase